MTREKRRVVVRRTLSRVFAHKGKTEGISSFQSVG
jgi:hypothetical protein